MITSRSNSTSIEHIHTAPSLITTKVGNDYISGAHEMIIGGGMINSVSMGDTEHQVKNIAAAAFIDNITNSFTMDDHACGAVTGVHRTATCAVINSSIAMIETNHVKKLIKAAAANAALEGSKNIIAQRSDGGKDSIPNGRRRRRERKCKPRLSLSLDIQESCADQMNGNSNSSDMGALMHGWLQAMRETSPPRTTSPTTTPAAASCVSSHYDHAISSTSTECQDLQLIHRAWMAKHPSALDKLEEIVEAASGKRVAVFLDYDGTLSPIVEDPNRAFMSLQMREIVKEVANVFPTAIISGRGTDKLHEFVQLPELYYAGSHGMDIVGPTRPNHLGETCAKGKETVLFQPAKKFTYVMDKVFKALEEKTKGVPGARVDHNKFCVSVHFRCVKERNWIALAEQVHQVLKSFPNVQLTQGRKVLEIRPMIPWNKGKALDYLLNALGLGDQNTVFPIYLGDDRSDEDAFKVLNRKKHGLGILVTTVAKETNAACSLRDPSEVGELLKRLVKWKSRRLNKYL